MPPSLSSWEDFQCVVEKDDDETGELYTVVVAVVDDTTYYGEVRKAKSHVSLEEACGCLAPIPDGDIFATWPHETAHLTEASKELVPADRFFIKRPDLSLYKMYLKYKCLDNLKIGLVEEAELMELLEKHPHPNIVRYHGCHVRRGHVMGLVLDRHARELEEYLKSGTEGTEGEGGGDGKSSNSNDNKIPDKKAFVEALVSALRHLHSLGYAHNDFNPSNILIADDGRPVLIDFNSSRKIGEKLTMSRGRNGWMDSPVQDYDTSETRHDDWALKKLAEWLESPTFG